MSNENSQTFREKRKQWLEMLSGRDPHSITNQLESIAWDMATFTIVREARKLAPSNSRGVELNVLIHSLFNRGFFICQAIAIRRLVDKWRQEGKKSVYSLSRLLIDMKGKGELFTRKAILDAEGKVCLEDQEDRNCDIDQLAGIESTNRSPNDTISSTIFDNLIMKIDSVCNEICDYVDKFIAHAATPESRRSIEWKHVEEDSPVLKLETLSNAYRQLCETTSFLLASVLGEPDRGFLAMPQYNQFKYIERPLVRSSQIGNLDAAWREFHKECNRWCQWDIEAYEREFCNGGTADS